MLSQIIPGLRAVARVGDGGVSAASGRQQNAPARQSPSRTSSLRSPGERCRRAKRVGGRAREAMDRFVSNFTNRLDAKGRVSIPAPFRSVLARDGFDGLYCYPTLDRPALDAGGNALLAEIEPLIGRFPPYSDEREDFSAAL